MKEECNLNDKRSMEVGKGFAGEFNPKVNMKLELFDGNGKLKELREIHNAVTTAGKAGLMDQILGTPTLAKPGWCELGTGTGGSTLLTTYIPASRTAFTSKSRATNVVTMVTDFAAGVGTGAITEAGLFDVVTQNTANMWCYASFAAINKAAADTLKITWTLTGN